MLEYTHRVVRNIVEETIEFQIYDIVKDPKELSPIALLPQHKGLIQDVAQVYTQRKAQIDSIAWPASEKSKKETTEKPASKNKENPNTESQQDEEELEMLRQLGYIE